MTNHSQELIQIIESLPGIDILQKDLEGFVLSHPYIFFTVDEKEAEGLFFLTRCVDRRYWEFGNNWRIELSVGDQTNKNGDRPIIYQLHRPESRIKEPTLVELQTEYKSLIDNMYYHFTHENFMNGFNMSRDKIGHLPWRREYKLEELGIN